MLTLMCEPVYFEIVQVTSDGINFVSHNNITDKYASQFGAGSSYAYYHDEDESTFHLVDTTRVQKPPYQRGRARGQRGRGARGARTPGGMTTLSKVTYLFTKKQGHYHICRIHMND